MHPRQFIVHLCRVEATSGVAGNNHTENKMDPSNLIMWAVCIGVAWLIFASFTGADEGLKSLFGKSTIRDLEERIEKLEKRLDTLAKK